MSVTLSDRAAPHVLTVPLTRAWVECWGCAAARGIELDDPERGSEIPEGKCFWSVWVLLGDPGCGAHRFLSVGVTHGPCVDLDPLHRRRLRHVVRQHLRSVWSAAVARLDRRARRVRELGLIRQCARERAQEGRSRVGLTIAMR